jgi:hypothetical protein
MNKKVQNWAIVLSLVVIGIFVSLIFVKIQEQSELEDVFSKTTELFSQEELSFEGHGELSSGGRQYKASFQTSISGENSITNASAKLLGGRTSLELDLFTAGDASYIRLNNASQVLVDLPSDPISNAVKNNLKLLVDSYEDRWIELEDSDVSEQVSLCILGVKPELFQNQEFIKSFEKTRGRLDEREVLQYEFVLEDGLKDVSPKSCDLSNKRIYIYIDDESGDIAQVTVGDKRGSITMKSFKVGAVQVVEEPESSLKFTDLKKQLENLTF